MAKFGKQPSGFFWPFLAISGYFWLFLLFLAIFGKSEWSPYAQNANNFFSPPSIFSSPPISRAQCSGQLVRSFCQLSPFHSMAPIERSLYGPRNRYRPLAAQYKKKFHRKKGGNLSNNLGNSASFIQECVVIKVDV